MTTAERTGGGWYWTMATMGPTRQRLVLINWRLFGKGSEVGLSVWRGRRARLRATVRRHIVIHHQPYSHVYDPGAIACDCHLLQEKRGSGKHAQRNHEVDAQWRTRNCNPV